MSCMDTQNEDADWWPKPRERPTLIPGLEEEVEWVIITKHVLIWVCFLCLFIAAVAGISEAIRAWYGRTRQEQTMQMSNHPRARRLDALLHSNPYPRSVSLLPSNPRLGSIRTPLLQQQPSPVCGALSSNGFEPQTHQALS